MCFSVPPDTHCSAIAHLSRTLSFLFPTILSCRIVKEPMRCSRQNKFHLHTCSMYILALIIGLCIWCERARKGRHVYIEDRTKPFCVLICFAPHLRSCYIMRFAGIFSCALLMRSAAAAAAAAAMPEPTSPAHLVERESCSNNAVANVIKALGALGTTFCSNYLRGPAKTTQTTTSTSLLYVTQRILWTIRPLG